MLKVCTVCFDFKLFSVRTTDCSLSRPLQKSEAKNISIAPWWLATVLVIKPALSMSANGAWTKLKTFPKDGFCHYKFAMFV